MTTPSARATILARRMIRDATSPHGICWDVPVDYAIRRARKRGISAEEIHQALELASSQRRPGLNKRAA